MKIKYCCLPILITVLISSRAFGATPQEIDIIKKASAYCIGIVHATRAQQAYSQQFYDHFDAFYNPASGLVENNAKLVGDQDPLFVFRKCMSEQGVSLS